MAIVKSGGRNHAIVIGGSMAGILAARVLADYYREVTVIERDSLPAIAAQRRGVPQGRHTHGLLASGSRALEKFFPGITAALIDAGAVTGDVVRNFRWFMEGGYLTRPPGDLNVLLLTRPMLETAVRERVCALPNVRMRDNTAVDSLAVSEGRDRVTGVQVDGETLAGDLVVDATGRGSRTPRWLEEMRYEKPGEESVQVGLGYTTRFFRRMPDHLGGDLGAIIPRSPEGKRSGVMIAQEGGRWTVTLIAYFRNYAPEELDGFIEFARTLPAPDIYDIVRRAKPLGDAATFRFPASVRRRYEKLSRFPSGLLVTGDAICSFNPAYGQGMSVTALEAVALEKTLAENSGDLARRFFARAATVVDIPWSIAVGGDLRIPEVQGRRPQAVKFMNWYMPKLHKAAHSDPAVALAFHRVSNLMAPPPSIMRPGIALRVLWRNLTAPPREAAASAQMVSKLDY